MIYKVKGIKMENYLSEHGLVPSDFCKKFDIDFRTYDKIVCGEQVKLTTLFVLAHRLGLSLNDFLA